MTEANTVAETVEEVTPVQAEDLLGLNPDVIRDAIVALENGSNAAGVKITASFYGGKARPTKPPCVALRRRPDVNIH